VDRGFTHCTNSSKYPSSVLTLAGFFAREIQTDPPGKVRNFSGYDPDGNIVEFVELLDSTPGMCEAARSTTGVQFTASVPANDYDKAA